MLAARSYFSFRRSTHRLNSLPLKAHRTLWTAGFQPLTDGFLDLAIALPWPLSFPPYASSIILTTIVSRFVFTLPFSIWAKRRQWRLEEQAIPELKTYMKNEAVRIAQQMKDTGFAAKGIEAFKAEHRRRLKPTVAARQKEIFALNSCTPLPTMLIPIVSQLPHFIMFTAFFTSLSVHPTPLDEESFLTLTSLARPDSTGVLPVALGLVTLANVETAHWFVGAQVAARRAKLDEQRARADEARRNQGLIVLPRFRDGLQGSLRLLSVFRIIIGTMVDGSVLVYWISSATFGLIQSWAFNWWDARKARSAISESASRSGSEGSSRGIMRG